MIDMMNIHRDMMMWLYNITWSMPLYAEFLERDFLNRATAVRCCRNFAASCILIVTVLRLVFLVTTRLVLIFSLFSSSLVGNVKNPAHLWFDCAKNQMYHQYFVVTVTKVFDEMKYLSALN